MAVHINIPPSYIDNNDSSSINDKDDVVHSLPFHIRSNGPAPVSKYFSPTIRKSDDGELKCSFRGHPIIGRICKIPEGFSGYVVQEKKTTECEGHERTVRVTGKFNKYYYWGSKETLEEASLLPILKITKLIHQPITDSS